MFSDFQRRRRRQIWLLVLGLPFLVVLAGFRAMPAQLNNAVAGGLGLAAIGYVAFACVFSLWNWRCPACGRWLGNQLSPARCRKCGVNLQ